MQIFSAASYLARFETTEPIVLGVEGHSFEASDPEHPVFESDASELDRAHTLRDEIESALREEFESRLAQEHSAATARLGAMRTQWVREESATLSKALDEAIDLHVKALRDDVASLLTPFISQAVRTLMLDDLVRIIEGGLRNSAVSNLAISAPPDLVAAAREALSQRDIRFAIGSGDEIDVSASSGATTVQTQLQAWLFRLSKADETK